MAGDRRRQADEWLTRESVDGSRFVIARRGHVKTHTSNRNRSRCSSMRRAKWLYAVPFPAKQKVTVSGRFPRIDGGWSRSAGRSSLHRWVRGRQEASTSPSQIRGVVTSWGPAHPGRVPEGYESAIKGLRVVKVLAELILAPVSGRAYISQESRRKGPIGGGSGKLLDLSPPVCQFL